MFCRRLLLQCQGCYKSQSRVNYKESSKHDRLIQFQLVYLTNRLLSSSSSTDTVLSNVSGTIVSPVNESISIPGTLLDSAEITSAPVSEISSVAEVAKIAVEQLPSFTWYKATNYVTHAMDFVQTTTGLPWWATLVCFGVVFRASMLPCNIWMQRIRQKFLPVQPDFERNRIAQQAAFGAKDTTKLMVVQAEKKYLISKHGVSPGSNFKPIVVICVCTSIMFLSITSLTNMPYAPLLTTDILWLTNLTVADPSRVLAAFNGVLVVALLKSGLETGKNPMIDAICGSPLKIVGFITVMGLIQGKFSAALLIYWISSNVVGLVMVNMLQSESFRKIAGLIPRKEMAILEENQPSLEDMIKGASVSKTKTRKAGQSAEMMRNKRKAEELATKAIKR